MELILNPEWRAARYVRRLNRFVREFTFPDHELVRAHIPNPGRLEEFRFPGRRLVFPNS